MSDLQQHNLNFGDLLRLSTRIFTVKPTRTILTILGTSIGIATVVFLISLGYGLQFILLGQLITTEDSLITLQATYPDESPIRLTTEEIENISNVPGVAEISRIAEFTSEINDGLGSVVRIVDNQYFRLSGTIPGLGKSFEDGSRGAVITSQALLLIGMEATEASLGKPISVKIEYTDVEGRLVDTVTASDIPIIGIILDDAEAPLAYIPAAIIEKSPPYYKEIFIKAADIEMVEPLRDTLIERGLIISARLDLVNQAQKILNIITITLGVFGIAALTVSAVGMFNTMIVSFLERTYEVGVMKSLGAMDKDVRNLFLMESAIMGLAGGVSGIAMGMIAGQLFNFGLNILAQNLGGEPLKLFHTPTWFILLVLTSSSFIGLFAGFWPARRASGLSPKEAFLRK